MPEVSKFELVVRVVTACSIGGPPAVGVEFAANQWTIRISNQTAAYKGKSLDEACESLLKNWDSMAKSRVCELDHMRGWLLEAYPDLK